MKVLVTGAYGQLGNELRVEAENYPEMEFLFTDADSLDITDEIAVQEYFTKNRPGIVINCAAYTAVDKAENDAEKAELINSVAPGFLAKVAKTVDAALIHISTDYVFGGDSVLPYTENDSVKPIGVYGTTKLEGEERSFKENLKTVVIRTAWLYSSFGNNFVKTMLRLGKKGDNLKVVFDQVGTPTYAGDLAKAVLQIANIYQKQPDKFVPGIYHYSNEGVISWYDFAKAIFELAQINCGVFPVLSEEFPTAAQRPHFSVLNKSKIKSTFGLEIPYWKDSLKVCIQKL
ncbi:dTDP-4-dehydrorhamnose reductase [Mariniphaga anaerophila]|uniref:dTDP-4-dehydrorhamnose reductase n=1 Tax=Mariniphaga anaerophila TaxID=1484053 RepID=A0A1M4SII4_9BACT|nr:dTDP-4-dehydrorhamnose reductase [Mariniphaga anaerophila]SHE32025.1 dTDP-4-dehydrorhamnose reductase [Mariniphaga anaerophila]